MKTALFALLATAAMPLSVMAQETPPDGGKAEDDVLVTGDRDEREANDDFHTTITITAAGLNRVDVIAGTSVVTGIQLQREGAGQVGEVLASLPGVSATGFAPGASRPILRGFGGDRVRVLTDGLGSLDASATSADHAVSADPLTADRIEVLRGPAVLLYGSQAIGGAVNIVTKRIPPRQPDEAVHLDALAGIDTASNLREAGLSLDAPIAGGLVAHVDASWRQTDDVEIPGFAASPSLRADLLADAEEEEEEGHLEEAEELREAASIRDVLPNSYTETLSAGAGLAYFQGESNFGISFGYYDTEYGIPGLPGVGHVHGEEEGEDEAEDEEEEGPVSIGLEQYRVDLRGAIDLGSGFFDALTTRIGWSDYTHTEFEGDEVGTVFDVEGVEGRVELVQSRRALGGGSLSGSLGLQYSQVDFDAEGAEAYIPRNSTESLAFFTLQELAFNRFELEAGARYESTQVDATDVGLERSFDTFSAALGGNVPLGEDIRLGTNLSRTERAPSAQELYADGPHIATQQFELGDDTLDVESSWGAEGYLRGSLGRAKVNLGVYANWFEDFIYLQATGEEEDGLPVFAYRQQDADQWGVEAQVTMPLMESEAFSLLADLRGDYTRATLSDGTSVPRIPPLSLYGALEARWDHFDLRGEVEWFAEQDRVAPLETPTDSFAFVNASLAWHPFEGDENFTLLAQVDNIFDTEGRRAASFTKDFVPLPGRNFKLTARASF
ncbi:MAG: TonB-dependent receptor [Alteraurantiacibacter sp.]